ncbi:F-box associated interaction domain [Arabidopsis suecica]|uniref:F-box associated interaction domain n=1 Tax=Arabidopsis suecica TaxID=45249 RepID=A0A8T2G735_ARASU|nr:F-box associated interaction domain [Arabidopsis suecica]
MDNAVVKRSSPSSNISEVISKFAKVCKFRSIGVFPDQKSNSNEILVDDKAKETEICDFNHKPSSMIQTFSWDDGEISKLFDIVSSLKLAYLEFQQAHLPYDPDKIIEADNLVVSQLEALRRIKRLYLKTIQLNAKKTEIAASCLDRLRYEIEVNEKHLEKLKAQVRAKESEIHSLIKKQECLVAENRKLENRIVSVSSFEFAFRAASKSVHDFAKPLITLMKATDWNLEKAVESIVGNVTFAKTSDKKYAFESYIVRRMFHGIKLNPCDVTELMSFDDPLDALTAFSDSAFSRFCGQKYLLVVHPSMEASFFGNLDMRGLVLLGWVNVLNPCTGEFLRFPSGPNPVDTSRYDNHRVIEGASWLAYYPGYWAMGFGKDKVNGTYKIVRMFYDTNQFEILDLTIGEWRTMPNPPPYYVQPNHHSAFVNGSIYWYDLVTGYKILALDLHTEQFRDVPRPHGSPTLAPLANLEDRLAMVCDYEPSPHWKVAIWTMDTQEEMWTKSLKLTKYVYSLDIFAPTIR